MATAPLEQEAHVDEGDSGPIDYEARAREYGWRSLDELPNMDPTHFVDAKTFVERADNMMPILKASNKRLERELKDLRKQVSRASEFFSKAEQRGYEKAMREIEAKQEAAFESGDKRAFDAARDEARALQKEVASASGSDNDDAGQRADDFADWGKANKWYATNTLMQAYADSQAQILANSKGGMLSRADLDEVSQKVRDKFEDDFPEAFAKPEPRRKQPMVDGGGQRHPTRGGKTFNDLPPEAKAACEKWVKQGLIKSREDYVKSYQW